MKNCKSLFLVGILGLLVFPVVASAQNLLINSDFETGDLTGWVVFGESPASSVTVQSPDNGPSFGGSHNAFSDNQGHAIGLHLKQSSAAGSAAGGGTAHYLFDLKLDQADVGGVVFVQVWAEQAGGGILSGSGLIGPLWPWNDWGTFSGSFEAPANTDFLTIQIEANTGAADGTNCLVHIDNVYLGLNTPVATEEMSMGSIKALFR